MSRPLVVTYRDAYGPGETSLCSSCAEHPAVLEHLPALGPVSHGAHRGACDGCAIRRRHDLVVGDSISTVLTAAPALTADEVIDILDEATADHAEESQS